MADEPKPDIETPQDKGGKVVFDSQEDFNAVIDQRIARVKKQYTDYDDMKSEVETLRQKEAERRDSELSEIDKFKQALIDKETEIETLKPYQEKWTAFEESQKAAVESAIATFSDDDKDLVLSLPLDKQMKMVEKITGQDTRNVNNSKGKPPNSLTEQFNAEMSQAKTAGEVEAVFRKWQGRLS